MPKVFLLCDIVWPMYGEESRLESHSLNCCNNWRKNILKLKWERVCVWIFKMKTYALYVDKINELYMVKN